MPGRKQESGIYRYGFNGKENDANGEFGSQLIQDYGFRMYNPSIARFLSVDPLTGSYPMLTPYQFASNSPIAGIDLDGLEFLEKTSVFWFTGDPIVKVVGIDNLVIKDYLTFMQAMRGSQFDIDVPDPAGTPYQNKQQREVNTNNTNKVNEKIRKAIEHNKKATELKGNTKGSIARLDIITVMMNTIEGAVGLVHIYKNGEAIKHSSESLLALRDAHSIVKSAVDNGVLPDRFVLDRELTIGLVNYLIDGSLPKENKELIETVGLALFKYRDDVKSGQFTFNETMKRICIGCDTDHPVYIDVIDVIDDIGRTTDEVFKAAKEILEKYIDRTKDKPTESREKVKEF